jgi:serine/threonine-protein kinase
MTTTLGDYRLIATLGRGGMAEVFLAVRHGHGGFTKLVVIKRLRPDLVELGEAARYRTLILDEARLAARLHHPGIVQTYEVHADAGAPYLAMEYLDGQPLSQVFSAAHRARVRVPDELVLKVIGDVLAALDYAHELRDYGGAPLAVVHRDVSPQNLFWTYDGDLKLMDFGVAKFATGSSRTEAGMVKGKLTYMAPEQARGQPVDRRADLFAVGIILWELLAGRRLLRADNDAASLQKLLFEPFPALDQVRPDVDPAIAAICARALDRDPALRYQTAAAMRAELERVPGARAARREDLAAFVAPLFVAERRDIAALIDRAVAGGADDSLVLLRRPELSSSRRLVVDPDREPTLAERAPIATPPTTAAAPPPAWRWRRGLRPAAIAAAGAVALALAWPRGTPPIAAAGAAGGAPIAPAPAPAPAPPTLRLCGSNTIGAELAPALVVAFLRMRGATGITRGRGAEPEETVVSAALPRAPSSSTSAPRAARPRSMASRPARAMSASRRAPSTTPRSRASITPATAICAGPPPSTSSRSTASR